MTKHEIFWFRNNGFQQSVEKLDCLRGRSLWVTLLDLFFQVVV